MDLKKELENLPQHTAGTVKEFTTKHDCIVGLQSNNVAAWCVLYSKGETIQPISVPKPVRIDAKLRNTALKGYRDKQISILREAYPKTPILWVIVKAKQSFVRSF